MTELPAESDEEYPDWHTFDYIKGIDCKRVSDDSYQIRTKTFIMTLRKEGFDLYCESNMEKFNKWSKENPDMINIRSRDMLE